MKLEELAKMAQPIEVIFVDLDGVLVDFHRPLAALYGLDPDTLSDAEWAQIGEWGLGIPKDDLWQRVQAEGSKFWAQLPKLAWTDALWAACKAAAPQVVVLTTPGPFAESAAGKWSWVKEQLGTQDMLIGRPKEVCSKPGHVLIDDRAGYGPKWTAAGGVLLPLKRPWNPEGIAPEQLIAGLEAYARQR
jgi:hypothetical protein